MNHDLSLLETKKEWHGTLKAYIIGFIFSLSLTLISFLLVAEKLLTGSKLFYALIGLALLQAICQLLFFLHLGQEAKPRWETFIFYFMFFTLLIIVLGSLWIMYDLNERVMANMTAISAKSSFTQGCIIPSGFPDPGLPSATPFWGFRNFLAEIAANMMEGM